MFIGHYAPAFAIRALRPAIPLWLLFVAVQLVDVAWALLVLGGIEKLRIVPGITASNPLDLYYMPYTHSLVATLVWAAAAGFLARRLLHLSARASAGWIGAAVLSHWILDWLVHRPDLPLYDNTAKVGLGLWNFPAIAFALEAGLVFAALALYLRRTRPVDTVGRWGPLAFVLVMLAIQASVFFGPPPPSPAAAAATALFAYVLFAIVAWWLGRRRRSAGVV